jgi:YbbR domain-containing protein
MPMTEMRLAHKLRHNLGVKILSIVLALLLWSFVHGLQVVQREINVPMDYANLPDSLMLYSAPPQSMRVLVSGRTSELFLRMRFVREVKATIDLSAAGVPSHRILPNVSQVTSPRNPRVTLVRVLEPQMIDLRIVRRVERQVPVRVVWDGKVPEGYALVDSPSVQPSVVYCTGPDFMVERLTHIPTVPVGLRRRNGSFTEKVALFFDDERLDVTPNTVSVAVPMARIREQQLAEVSVQVNPPPDSLQYQLSNPQVRLILRGPEARMAALTADEVQLIVDLSLFGVGEYDSVSVEPHIPGWAQLVRMEPASISAVIRIAPGSQESTAPRVPAPGSSSSTP